MRFHYSHGYENNEIMIKAIYYQLCDKLGRKMREFVLNKLDRKKLKQKKFTIISQNCTGSIWYHDLNIPFYSPTIKMRFDGNDFIVFLKSFDKYLNSEFEFYRNESGQIKGILGGDIHMSFIHWNSYEAIREKWEKRKSRICEPVIVLAFAEDMSDNSIIEYLNLTSYPNRLLFINEQRAASLGLTNSDIVRTVKGNRDNAQMLNFCSLMGHRFYQKHFDYVEYINRAVSNDHKQN